MESMQANGGLDPRIPGAIPGKCRREKICRDGPDFNGIVNPVEDCPKCRASNVWYHPPPTGNCTNYDTKAVAQPALGVAAALTPWFCGTGREYGCEPCYDTPPKGRCEPQPIK